MTDPYEVLGVSRDADPAAIKAAYRKLAMEHHPDRHGGSKDAEDRFKAINAAYDEIKDGKPQGAAGWQNPNNGFSEFHFHGGMSHEDILRAFRFASAPPAANRHVQATHAITLEQAFSGCQIIVAINLGDDVREVSVTVPAGVNHGTRLRVAGAGERLHSHLPTGDLYVHIQIVPHERFDRIDANLACRITVDAIDAILGTETTVEGIDGTIAITVPAGSHTGSVIRHAGRGMPRMNDNGRGDFLAVVEIGIPTDISDDEKTILEDFRALRSTSR